MKFESPIAFGFTECSGRGQALPAGVSSSTENALVPCSLFSGLSSICGPLQYIDRLPCPSASFSASCCATTARTLPRNNHLLLHPPTHHRQTDSPHIQAQPRASSRSRPACPARRAALSQTPVVAVVVVAAAAVANLTPRAASPKVRSLPLPCPAIITIPPLGTHTARVRWSFRSLLAARLASIVSSSRTHDTRSRSNLRSACWLATPGSPAATSRLRSPSSSALPPHELSSCSRARNSV